MLQLTIPSASAGASEDVRRGDCAPSSLLKSVVEDKRTMKVVLRNIDEPQLYRP